jgi:rhodanese-related sulfurtransferase
MVHSPGFLTLVNDARTRIRETDVAGYKEMIARGKPHLSKGIIERDVEAKYPDKETTMVLYCGGGFRSALAADALGRMGYTNAISLDGGWRALKESGLPIE